MCPTLEKIHCCLPRLFRRKHHSFSYTLNSVRYKMLWKNPRKDITFFMGHFSQKMYVIYNSATNEMFQEKPRVLMKSKRKLAVSTRYIHCDYFIHVYSSRLSLASKLGIPHNVFAVPHIITYDNFICRQIAQDHLHLHPKSPSPP